MTLHPDLDHYADRDWHILYAAIRQQLTPRERSELYWWALVTCGYTPERPRP